MKRTLGFLLILFLSLALNGDSKTKAEISFKYPKAKGNWIGSQTIEFTIQNIDPKLIHKVELYLDGKLIKEFDAGTYAVYHDFGPLPKNRWIKVLVRDSSQKVILQKQIRSKYVDDFHKVDVVQIGLPVAVTDEKGNYISGLKAEDFEVLEDGTPQTIHYFTTSRISRANIVLLVDISSSMKDKIGQVKQAAQTFLKELIQGENRAIIILFNHDVFESTDFSSDLNELNNSLTMAFPFGATALYDAVAYSIKLLKGMSGRNIIIIFSDGDDNSSYIDPFTLMDKAKKSSSAIYSIGRDSSSNDPQYQDVLKKISQSSGGLTFFLEDISQLETIYSRIKQDIKAKYILHIAPKGNRSPHKFRHIKIRLKKHKRFKVRTIKGYYY